MSDTPQPAPTPNDQPQPMPVHSPFRRRAKGHEMNPPDELYPNAYNHDVPDPRDAELVKLRDMERLTRERDAAQELNEYFRDSVGECHVMISRNTSEYQIRKQWEPTDLPPRVQKVMQRAERLESALALAREALENCSEWFATECVQWTGVPGMAHVAKKMEELRARTRSALACIAEVAPKENNSEPASN